MNRKWYGLLVLLLVAAAVGCKKEPAPGQKETAEKTGWKRKMELIVTFIMI